MLAAYFYYEIDPAAVTVLASPFVVFLLWSYLPLSVLPTQIVGLALWCFPGLPWQRRSTMCIEWEGPILTNFFVS